MTDFRKCSLGPTKSQQERALARLLERDGKGDHGFRVKPKGSTNGGYRRARVQIGFEKWQLDTITKLAKKNGRSFASEVRALVATALGK